MKVLNFCKYPFDWGFFKLEKANGAEVEIKDEDAKKLKDNQLWQALAKKRWVREVKKTEE